MWNRIGLIAYFALLCGLGCITFSIALGQVFLVISIIATAGMLLKERRFPTLTVGFFFAVAFFCIALATGMLGLDPARSALKVKRLIWFVALIPVAATFVTSMRRVNEILQAVAVGTGFLVIESCVAKPILAWLDFRSGEPGAADYWTALIHRGSITDGQMLMLGVLASLGLFYGRCAAHGKGRFWRILLPLQSLALILSFKRGAWIGAIGFVMIFITMERGWRYLALVVAVIALAFTIPPVQTRLHDLRSEMTFEKGGRLTMWFKVAPTLVKEHPWGIGYAALSNDLMRSVAPNVERERRHLHSNCVQILVELGWLGLFAYLAWMAKAVVDSGRMVRLARRQGNRADAIHAKAILLMLLALIVNGVVEYNFGDTELITMYAILIGSVGGVVRASGSLPPAPPEPDAAG